LTAALLTAFFGLWVGLRVHALQASFYGIGVTINDLMANSSSEEMFQESYGQVIQDLVEPIGKNDRTAETLFTISSCLFCAAMLLLAIVGFRQLLA
jgi:phosphoribosylformylglycinamidine (FGAM) synthase-like enzyme